jgi:hypothetical protein
LWKEPFKNVMLWLDILPSGIRKLIQVKDAWVKLQNFVGFSEPQIIENEQNLFFT